MFGDVLQAVEFSSNWRRRRSRQVYTRAVFQAHLIREAAQYRDERAVLLRQPSVPEVALCCVRANKNAQSIAEPQFGFVQSIISFFLCFFSLSFPLVGREELKSAD